MSMMLKAACSRSSFLEQLSTALPILFLPARTPGEVREATLRVTGQMTASR